MVWVTLACAGPVEMSNRGEPFLGRKPHPAFLFDEFSNNGFIVIFHFVLVTHQEFQFTSLTCRDQRPTDGIGEIVMAVRGMVHGVFPTAMRRPFELGILSSVGNVGGGAGRVGQFIRGMGEDKSQRVAGGAV